MTTATVSLIGLWSIKQDFMTANLQLPEPMNKEDVCSYIMAECSDLEVLYPDADVMGEMIRLWSSSRVDSWKRMLNALTSEYELLRNFTKTEEWTEGENSSKSNQHSATTGSKGSQSNQGNNNTTETKSVSAFDSASDFVPSEKAVNSGSGSSNLQESREETRNDNGSETGSKNTTRTGKISGYDGSAKYQDLINAELRLRNRDIIDIIVNEFRNKFCLLVY